MKYLIIASLIILLSSGVFAQEIHFKDVPAGFWATEAVYDLVKLGVTTGYPDGTFRGKKNITRYEVAALLTKFAQSLNLDRGKKEKLIEELKTEVALIKYKREQVAKINGYVMSRARATSIAPQVGKLDYRLKVNWLRKFNANSSLKICLDTVDAGFNTSATREIATSLIDVESRFKLGGLNYQVNLGPGDLVHTESDGFFPSENNTIFIRPKTAIQASGRAGKLNYSASYVTRQVQTSGLIGVHELAGKLKYKFGRLAVFLQPCYLFVLDGGRDVLGEVGVNYAWDKNSITYLLLGAGDFQAGNSGLYAKFVHKMLDPGKTGTNIVFRIDKVGSRYRDDVLAANEFVDLNNFDRYILDGTIDIGLKVNQKLAKNISVEWKGDYVARGDYQYGAAYPGTYFLWQLALNYDVAANIGLNAFYRSYNVPSGVAQFSDPVPTVSDMFGLGVKCVF